MTITGGGKRNIVVRSGLTSDKFDFAGGSYKWTDNLSTSYHYGKLDNFYKQHYLGLVHTLPIADKQSLKSDIRWARSTDDGSSNVDNKALNAMFTYSLGYHAFGVGYQKMSGDTGFAYINGADPYLVNFIQIGDFANKDEKSWQARYDYNFAGVGIPGLTFADPLRQGRQHRPADHLGRRQGMGTRHGHRLRVPERPVEEPRGEVAQRDHAHQLHQRLRRKSPDRQLHAAALVTAGPADSRATAIRPSPEPRGGTKRPPLGGLFHGGMPRSQRAGRIAPGALSADTPPDQGSPPLIRG